MRPFDYVRAEDDEKALAELAKSGAALIGGGTNLLDLMKEDVARPTRLVDVNRLKHHRIEALSDGGLRLGALATNAETAYSPLVAEGFPLIAKAILAGASAQIRNMATNGGNLLQRTRCHYFYDVATPCNKRTPGSGCSAIGGENRQHAILGASPSCIAVHPSDLCVALAALDAKVVVVGPHGERAIAFADFHRLPEDTPERDTNLANDELITSIDVPAASAGLRAAYLKVRDRQSFAFALVSVAAALRIDGGVVTDARVALGGVAHKPWRVADAEKLLVGKVADRASFGLAADRLLRGATGYGKNDFKVPLAKRAIVRALEEAIGGSR